MTKFRITRSWPRQSLHPTHMDFDSMTEAYLYLFKQSQQAMQSHRVFDTLWLSDDEMALTSPTGRVIEVFTLGVEEVADGN